VRDYEQTLDLVEKNKGFEWFVAEYRNKSLRMINMGWSLFLLLFLICLVSVRLNYCSDHPIRDWKQRVKDFFSPSLSPKSPPTMLTFTKLLVFSATVGRVVLHDSNAGHQWSNTKVFGSSENQEKQVFINTCHYVLHLRAL
jgi:hypothetical protein